MCKQQVYKRIAVRSAPGPWPPSAELGPQLAPRPLTARPTETGTHQGESHDVEKNHRPGSGDLFSISGPAINKLGDLG